MTQLDIHIRRLEANDDRTKFDCGNIDLNRFFQRYAGQNQFKHFIGASYVALYNDHITGFVTVSSGELTADKRPVALLKKFPTYPLPILRIARLAVDKHFQGYGIGHQLLRSMLELALEMQQRTGCVGVVVDAKREAVAFYETLGFCTLNIVKGSLGDRPQTVSMFLPIQQISIAAEKSKS